MALSPKIAIFFMMAYLAHDDRAGKPYLEGAID
jgi:hypothetical protein